MSDTIYHLINDGKDLLYHEIDYDLLESRCIPFENTGLVFIGDKNIMRTEEHRKRQAELVRGNKNPMRTHPHKNHTAKPIVVTYFDESKEYYTYAKIFDKIPYPTVKYLLQTGKSSNKHQIKSIKKVSG